MASENEQDRDREVQERIAEFMHADGQGDTKQLAEEELQALQSAARRLEGMLEEAEESERQALRAAAARLDRLLLDIDAGKDVLSAVKRRSDK